MASEYNQYTFNLYVSHGSTQWSNFQDTGRTIKIGIPSIDDADFYTWFEANVSGRRLQNYLTGIYTDEFYDFNDRIPMAYFRTPGIKNSSASLSASRAFYQTFPAAYDISGILAPYISDYTNYYFAITSEDSPYYVLCQINPTGAQTGYYFAPVGSPTPYLWQKSDDSSISTISLPFFNHRLENTEHDITSSMVIKYGDRYMAFNVSSPQYEGTYLWCWWNGTIQLSETESSYLSSFLGNIPTYAEDPFTPGGSTDPGGGTGTFDDQTEPIDFPSLPTLSAVDTGFITLFNPSAGELKALANYMWGSLFDISTWKKIFADPMDAILGLSIVPVAVDDAGPSTVTVGNISTGITMNKAASQYKEVDCGSLDIQEYWGAYLDYDPYTKAELYLPYCGTHPIAVDDIMGKTVHIKYHVDILSGSCCCYVKCGESVLYTFAGQCSCSVPITGNDWTNVVNGALSIAASIGTMVATGGATAPMAAGAIASTAVNSLKPTVEKSGSLGGMAGMLAIQKPYLILTRPRQALPKDQNKFSGYPSFINKKLGLVTGYTEVESIHLEGIQATDSELAEIENLLKSGVIL